MPCPLFSPHIAQALLSPSLTTTSQAQDIADSGQQPGCCALHLSSAPCLLGLVPAPEARHTLAQRVSAGMRRENLRFFQRRRRGIG